MPTLPYYSCSQKFLVAVSQPGPPQSTFQLLLPLLILTYPTVSKIKPFRNCALYVLISFISSASIPLLSSQQLKYNFPFKTQIKCSQICPPYLSLEVILFSLSIWGGLLFFLSCLSSSLAMHTTCKPPFQVFWRMNKTTYLSSRNLPFRKM